MDYIWDTESKKSRKGSGALEAGGENLKNTRLKKKRIFLPKYFLRPSEGEKIPIQVLDFKQVYGAWVPELKSSIYFELSPKGEKDEFSELSEAEGLKRVREVIILKAYDWFREREGVIELSEEEFEQFEQVYTEFLQKCGEIQYSRKKVGRKTENLFELKEKPFIVNEVRKGFFSEKL
ncbi:MAG: hypothetical protein PHD26_06935 [Methanosarcinaceae archaeon]|nr:hypothetical protein [Methanosarcinaceae archaeon]MDD4749647.1 hypothetical protein [Methanosarcinaceae archaeon]